MNHINDCEINEIDHEASIAWLKYGLGHRSSPMLISSPAWLLYHGDDGVTWGYIKDGKFKLSSTTYPEVCPIPSDKSLQEIRIFTPTFEVLIWRRENQLHGRLLRDEKPPISNSSVGRQNEERLLLYGHIIDSRDGFTHVGDGTGAEQVLPLVLAEGNASWPRMFICHYFSQDEDSGCVRVAATRLLEVK